MSTILDRFELTTNTISGLIKVKYELHQYATHFAIKAFRSDQDYPLVNVGKRDYIMKLWKQYLSFK